MNFKFLAESPWKRKPSTTEFHSPSVPRKSPISKSSSNTDRFIPYRIQDLDSTLLLTNDDDNLKEESNRTEDSFPPDLPKKRKDQTGNNYLSLLQNHVIASFQEEGLYRDSISAGDLDTASQFNHKFLKYKKHKKSPFENSITDYSPFKHQGICSPKKTHRKIQKLPYKILDAPNLLDDYYLNLLDWSSSNEIAIGLDNIVYIWSAKTSKASKAYEAPAYDSICSVSWNAMSSFLAIGESTGKVKLYDVEANKIIADIPGHDCRVGALAWNENLISSGSRDRTILNRDIRCPKEIVSKYIGHRQEVCGLKWSPDLKLLASGGNDNRLIVWSLKMQDELIRFTEHQAAVKAIAWNPHSPNVLASGGGKTDRCIKFWNMNTLKRLDSIDTGSQVCNLVFSKNTQELVSTHGYSLNDIIVWSYPSMEKIASLTGHSSRVLYLGLSPNGENIVTGAGDETLRFWHVFPPVKANNTDIFDRSLVFPSCLDLR